MECRKRYCSRCFKVRKRDILMRLASHACNQVVAYFLRIQAESVKYESSQHGLRGLTHRIRLQYMVLDAGQSFLVDLRVLRRLHVVSLVS
jgi:FixJ family two-component response regulator